MWLRSLIDSFARKGDTPMKRASRRHACSPASGCRARLDLECLEVRTLLSHTVVEIEPNNAAASANAIPLGFDPGEQAALTVVGRISPQGDQDWFKFHFNAGDVIGAAVLGYGTLNSTVSLLDESGTTLWFNDDDDALGRNLPPESPLPRVLGGLMNRDSSLYYMINAAGMYFIQVHDSDGTGTGDYKMNLVVARPPLEHEPVGTKQVLFVDFNGATVNFFAGKKTLSGLSSSLAGWGLTPADENALIDAVLAVMEENLSSDVRRFGLNGDYATSHNPGDFDIDIRNSRDHADEFGTNPLVSRVVIGGTAREAAPGGFGGLAQWIDVGNFSTDDDAVVLLDWLPPKSFFEGRIQSPTSYVDVIGGFIGMFASHEAGHYFGNLHTDIDYEPGLLRDPGFPNVMDKAPFLDTVLAGPDDVYGTEDDGDHDFGVDSYVDNHLSVSEGVTGIEDTLNMIAFGLATGKAPAGTSGPSGTNGPNTWPALSALNTDEGLFLRATPGGFGEPFTPAPRSRAVSPPDVRSTLFAVNADFIAARSASRQMSSLRAGALASGGHGEDVARRTGTLDIVSGDLIQLPRLAVTSMDSFFGCVDGNHHRVALTNPEHDEDAQDFADDEFLFGVMLDRRAGGLPKR